MSSDDQMEESKLVDFSFMENLYDQFSKNAEQLDSSWNEYFRNLESKKETTIVPKENNRIANLIAAYRNFGHLKSKLNPIALKPISTPDILTLEYHGLNKKDLAKYFVTEGILPTQEATLSDIIAKLENLYCGSIGFEFCDLTPEMEIWIQNKVESGYFQKPLSHDVRLFILDYLNRSELFENFLHTKYVGQKRFSLEGAETMIPMLAMLLEEGAKKDVQEIVIGMAHRGRLNVLANILQKSYYVILAEFDENYIPDPSEGMGDVKYHKGFEGIFKTTNGQNLKVCLPPNPSHLESVSPVVEGLSRAKQFLDKDSKRKKIIPILIHGDAALSGQGVVYETLQLSGLPGYTTGGTIHFVVNNQIGFTTIPRDSRSTLYCTAVARSFSMPIFHVNAEDPESCVKVTLLALELRQKFGCDVFLDLNCYRKYGHNEGDEPAFTQPHEYKIIKQKKPIRQLYHDLLIQENLVKREDVDRLENEFKEGLQKAFEKSKDKKIPSQQVKNNDSIFKIVDTAVSEGILLKVAEKISQIPEDFKLHPKVENLVKERLITIKEGKAIDWGLAETLAYATLLVENKSIRISGQDCGRGTFSHRHALWVDQQKEREYFPLAHIQDEQGTFDIFNSSLSEMAVLGFEFGYSVINFKGLNIWEAQFGDFSNGAQIIIDQYLSSSDQKWGQKSNLVLLLPHGFEGQGPEHSSARIERFLSLAANDNLIIVNPSTPAQFFHLLRRQVMWNLIKPLIVFTPKALLRLPACKSNIDEFTTGSFQTILDDVLDKTKIEKIVLCSGKIYFDLLNKRQDKKDSALAIIRIEQLYPLDEKKLGEIIDSYGNARECVWIQEEPLNMGAWLHLDQTFRKLLVNKKYRFIGRGASATPATGSNYYHRQEQENLLNQVFKNEN